MISFCKCGNVITTHDVAATLAAGFTDWPRCSECLAIIAESSNGSRRKGAVRRAYKRLANYSQPRGSTQRRRIGRPRKQTKKQKATESRRERYRREGRCPHCGEKCAPYYECATRRAYYRTRYAKHGAELV